MTWAWKAGSVILSGMDLLAEIEDGDVIVDQAADLLLVLVGIEVTVGCVAVTAPGPDLDLAE